MKRPELVAFALAGAVTIAATVLALAGDTVPTWFPVLALAAVSGGAGLSMASSSDATPPTDANGWTLAEISSWLETELVPKVEKAFARSHVHSPTTGNGGGGVAPTPPETPPPPSTPAETPPTPPTTPQPPAVQA